MDAKLLLQEKITKKLKKYPELGKHIGVMVAIVLTGNGGGRWVIDFTKEPVAFREDADTSAVTTVSMDVGTFVGISAATIDPQMAFLSGKIKVDGDLAIAIKLGELLK